MRERAADVFCWLLRLDDASGDYYTNASDDIGDLPQSGIDTSSNSAAANLASLRVIPLFARQYTPETPGLSVSMTSATVMPGFGAKIRVDM